MSIDRERIRRMSAAGYTNREIARELGCSHTRVAQVLAQDGQLEVTATVRAPNKHQVIIDTSDSQIAGVAVRRALERAGILLSDAGQSSGTPPKASNRNKEA
jgi:predicted transcriptional regulator